MSVFKTKTTTGRKITVNVSNLAYAVEASGSETTLVFADGLSIDVAATMRSVNGYIKKALAGAASEEEPAE